MRAFVALEIPATSREGLARLRHGIETGLRFGGPSVAWVDPGHYHFTLFFFGNHCPETAEWREDMLAALAHIATAFRPIDGAWAPVFALPSDKRPRAICVGTDRASEVAMEALAVRVENAGLDLLERHGVTDPFPERGGQSSRHDSFRAHLTIGRIKVDKGAHVVQKVLQAHRAVLPGGRATLDTLLLMRSDLTPNGPVYRELGRVGLGSGLICDSGAQG